MTSQDGAVSTSRAFEAFTRVMWHVPHSSALHHEMHRTADWHCSNVLCKYTGIINLHVDPRIVPLKIEQISCFHLWVSEVIFPGESNQVSLWLFILCYGVISDLCRLLYSISSEISDTSDKKSGSRIIKTTIDMALWWENGSLTSPENFRSETSVL